MQRVIERAKSKKDHDALGYVINETSVSFLSKFFSAISAFKYDFVTGKKNWWIPPDSELKKCSIHGVYLHVEGCVVCNKIPP